jgi:hypothetical protein
MRCAIFTACLGRLDGVVVQPGMVLTRPPGQLLGGDLVAHRGDAAVLGADEDDALLLDAAREVLVLGEEAVARVHGLGAGLLAGGDDLVGHQVTLAAGRRADAARPRRPVRRARVAVGLGIHGHGGDAHLLRGLDDAAGDLAAVGNQDLLEHGVPAADRWPCPRGSQRDVAVLAPRVLELLVLQHRQLRQMRLRVSCGWITSSM